MGFRSRHRGHSLSISLYTFVYFLAALVVCALCLRRGDRPLRLAAVTTIVSWSVTPLLGYWDRYSLNVPQTLTDVVTALIFFWISLRWRRLWAVALTALLILIVLCPLVYVTDARVHRNSWIAANNILAVAQLAVLLAASRLTPRERMRADEGAVRP